MKTETLKCRNFVRNLARFLVMSAVFSTTGCKDNPAKWPPDRIASKVAESLEISGLKLTPTANGLEGSGKRSDGETINVTVTLHPDTFEYRYDAKGDRGFVEEGKYLLE